MTVIFIETKVEAEIETVFDLARSIDLHLRSTSKTKERAVAGRTSGLIELGETVTWEATHFFIRQRLTVRIEAYWRPHHFRDAIVTGVFKRFDHDHRFEVVDGGTLMTDRLDFESPLGILGDIANGLIVTRHLRNLLKARNKIIQSVAESDDRYRYIDAGK